MIVRQRALRAEMRSLVQAQKVIVGELAATYRALNNAQ
jgi:hypothetical protein